jgi:hypothetical protein
MIRWSCAGDLRGIVGSYSRVPEMIRIASQLGHGVSPTRSWREGSRPGPLLGRRTGLKIRWGNTRVGSSPTFGTEMSGSRRYKGSQAYRAAISAIPVPAHLAARDSRRGMPRSKYADQRGVGR